MDDDADADFRPGEINSVLCRQKMNDLFKVENKPDTEELREHYWWT